MNAPARLPTSHQTTTTKYAFDINGLIFLHKSRILVKKSAPQVIGARLESNARILQGARAMLCGAQPTRRSISLQRS
jgi:hypothetical protein